MVDLRIGLKESVVFEVFNCIGTDARFFDEGHLLGDQNIQENGRLIDRKAHAHGQSGC